ncbi:sugar hydrolase [Streptomyces malaysiensis subsp. malaysiensis]|nr:sugar hydrolase [Streptomyces malaysiensis]
MVEEEGIRPRRTAPTPSGSPGSAGAGPASRRAAPRWRTAPVLEHWLAHDNETDRDTTSSSVRPPGAGASADGSGGAAEGAEGSGHGFDGAFDTPAHRALALEAAEQAVVLLTNDGLLPLSEGAVRTLAVAGPLADECKPDWYGGSPIRRSSPREALAERLGADRVVFAEGLDTVRLRAAAGGGPVPDAAVGDGGPGEGSLNPADTAGRTDLPPLTVGDTPTELSLADWGGGLLTLRAPSGRHLTVAEDRFVRAAAERPGGWVVQETFTLEAHRDGHLLRRLGTGGYVCVAAGGLKVAEPDSGEEGAVFRLEVVERGEDAVACRADAVGRLLFRVRDFGAGSTSPTVEAANAPAGAGDGATVEVRLADGTALATAAVPPTGGPHAYTTVRADLPTPPAGVRDPHITLRGGDLRLARLGFSG